jgi:SPP1 gp7 family putative phage head morphogenesis protein
MEAAGFEVWTEELERTDPLTMPAQGVLAAIEDRENKISGAGEKIHADLRKELGEAIAQGETMDEIKARIRKTFNDMSENRVEMIARTETTRAWNKGSLEAARQNPNVGQKQWVAANDARTRPEHSAAHGQTVDKDEDFEVGGESCEGPGDPNLSAEQSINCRCTVRYVTGAFVDKPLAQFDDKGNLIP